LIADLGPATSAVVISRLISGRRSLVEQSMSLSMYESSAPVFARMLNNLTAILKKAEASAEARKIDPSVLINDRLAPDMFPLTRQIQIATDAAKGCVARLAGVEVPSYPDTETTFPDLYARIAKTVAFIEGVDAAAMEGTADKSYTIKMRTGDLTMTGRELLLNFANPNFYFHITTAYLILRHNGVDVGKPDYLGNR
jgi:uncharacterized protein